MIGAAACRPGAGLMPGLQMRISGKRGVCFVRQNVACVPNGVWERIAMLKYGIDDIRLYYENDLRFLSQF